MRTTKGELFKRGATGSYFMRYMVAGKRRTISLRTSNLKEAERERERILGDALRADTKEKVLFHVATARKLVNRAEASIETAWTKYLQSTSRPKSGPGTMDNYFRQWRRFSSWMVKTKPGVVNLFATDRHAALEYAANLEGAGIAPETYNQHIKTLRLVFKVLAVEFDATEKNPFEAVPLKARAQVGREAFTRDEVLRLLSVFDGEGARLTDAAELKTLFHIGAFSGLRLGDATQISWKDVDLPAGWIRLTPSKTSRTGCAVKIPVHPTLRAVLETRRQETDPEEEKVMPKLAREYENCREVVCSKVMTAIRLAGITTHKKIKGRLAPAIVKGFHSLRHFFASEAASAGIPVNVLAELLGDNVATLQRYYVHATEEAMTRAVESLSAPVAPALLPGGRSDADRVRAALAHIEGRGKLTGPQVAELRRILAD